MRLRRAFAARPPQILHTWQPEGNVIGLLAARGWSGARVVITHLNSWNARDYPGVMRLQRLLLGRADYAVSNSRGGAHLLAKAGLDTDRIALIRDGIPPRRVAVDASRREIRTAMGWEAQDVVAWVGRADDRKTTAQKGLETLFAAMGSVRARRPSARLVLIGPTGAELEANGFELPDWADALGWRPRPADLMNAADVVAIASRYEGFSNVAGEALMLGLPVVMTDCSDLCEAVSRAGGRVVAVADPEAMSAAIDALLARPPDRQHVRNVAAESISVERMVAAHLDVYRRLLCTK
jgi:glycosyltransferase involved in cell wall biosynthesis